MRKSKKKNNKRLMIGSVVIFVLFVVGLAWYQINDNKKNNIQVKQSKEELSVISYPYKNSVISLDWKKITINNSGFGSRFSFMIPASARYCDDTLSLNGPPFPNYFDDVELISTKDCSTGHPTIYLEDHTSPNGLIVEWTYLDFNQAKKGFLKSDLDKALITDLSFGSDESYFLNGQRSLSFYDDKNSDIKKSTNVYAERVIFHNEDESQIVVLTIQTDEDKGGLEIYQRILSTFEFVD